MKTKRVMIDFDVRFRILHRDKFKCRYCGASPGSSELEVDHLVPVSLGGGNREVNLVAACASCNRRRTNQPLFPHDMIQGEDDDGWSIIRRWGIWTIKACSRGVVVAGAVYSKDPVKAGYEYWFEISRAKEKDWLEHIGRKDWTEPHRFQDFVQALEYAMELTC